MMLVRTLVEGMRIIRLDKLNNWIKELSWKSELALVLLVGFGYFIYSSTRGFFFVTSTFEHPWTYNITSLGEYVTVIYELVTLSIIAYILKIRGWTLKDYDLRLTGNLFFVALLLMFLRNLIGGIGFKIFELLHVVDAQAAKHVQFGLQADWFSLVLIIVINSVFEEFLLVAYLFKRLEAYHPALIIGVGILIRVLFHSYQGFMMLFTIIPMGLVFGYYYYRYKKIWPLVIAHGLSNALVFLSLYFKSLHP